MSATEKNRDLSQLSALLARQAAAPTEIAKPTVAKVRQPANDNKPARALLAWPAFERLAHRGDYARLFALRHWKNMVFPQDIVIADDEPYDPEVAIEIRPSEAELLGAVGRKVTGRERWPFTGEIVNTYDDTPAPDTKYHANRNGTLDIRVGDLMFRDGELKQWGETKRGAALRPDERRRGTKGGVVKPGRSDGALRSYLDLKGAVSPHTATPYMRPLTTDRAVGDCFTPSAEVVTARKLLIDLGVDGSVPFNALPFAATLCEDFLVPGPQWIGGVKQPKPTASKPAGREPEFVRHFETMDYVDHLRSRLGKHAKVLDMAITDASATDIGKAMDLAPAYAEKRGTALIEAAIDALIDADETARAQFTPKEEKIAA
ncbi:hypothetical protein [Rhizobium leguminosarum]|uniref:hypothetical protein n=1 Tax=Rhizobium leguminosarum TaxID=384 RepID=UPI001C93F920|nr:hypothetical protein [Rhizobium leguminosarum]MBY5585295.1 hypothetical protein [Rhizobium leguminosarum]